MASSTLRLAKTAFCTCLLCISLTQNGLSSPKDVIKKNSSAIGYRFCTIKLHQYYHSINKKTLQNACRSLIQTSRPSVHHCIDNMSLLAPSSKQFNHCLIKQLRNNKPFIKQLYRTIMTTCAQKILSFHPKQDSHKLHTTCKKSAIDEMNNLVKHFLH